MRRKEQKSLAGEKKKKKTKPYKATMKEEAKKEVARNSP